MYPAVSKITKKSAGCQIIKKDFFKDQRGPTMMKLKLITDPTSTNPTNLSKKNYNIFNNDTEHVTCDKQHGTHDK